MDFDGLGVRGRGVLGIAAERPGLRQARGREDGPGRGGGEGRDADARSRRVRAGSPRPACPARPATAASPVTGRPTARRSGGSTASDPAIPSTSTRRTAATATRCVRTFTVRPRQVEVLRPTDEPTLTLTACHPPYSAAYRLIVQSRLVEVRRSARRSRAGAPIRQRVTAPYARKECRASTRHRRRRLHRLEPRPRAARERTRRRGDRRPLDGQAPRTSTRGVDADARHPRRALAEAVSASSRPRRSCTSPRSRACGLARDPERDWAVNADGTAAVARAARRRALGASSRRPRRRSTASPPTLPLTEDAPTVADEPLRTLEARGRVAACRGARGHGRRLRELCASATSTVRARTRWARAAWSRSSCDALGRGVPPIIYGDGKQTRDFIFVGDVVGAIVAALEATGTARRRPRRGAAYNISTGARATLNDLARRTAALAGFSAAFDHRPAREGDIGAACSIPRKAERVFGWAAGVPLSSGPRAHVALVRAHRRRRVSAAGSEAGRARRPATRPSAGYARARSSRRRRARNSRLPMRSRRART